MPQGAGRRCEFFEAYKTGNANRMSSVKIVLLTMVKNEERNIRRLFTSVRSWIDGIVLCDTGSTDGTVELAKTLLEEMGLPGRIYEFAWENFGKSRTNSFQCFQAWTNKYTQWDPTKVFCILLDGDIILPTKVFMRPWNL